ncbi:hypothetical protein KRX54_02005 [Actinomycetaceae bacterium TAE3-ERU4]|nr:hypothetical protein [Actinomycetaceae bacterium TAE3-ERU4]
MKPSTAKKQSRTPYILFTFLFLLPFIALRSVNRVLSKQEEIDFSSAYKIHVVILMVSLLGFVYILMNKKYKRLYPTIGLVVSVFAIFMYQIPVTDIGWPVFMALVGQNEIMELIFYGIPPFAMMILGGLSLASEEGDKNSQLQESNDSETPMQFDSTANPVQQNMQQPESPIQYENPKYN